MAINLMYIKWESDVLWGTPDYADADNHVEHVFFKIQHSILSVSATFNYLVQDAVG